MKTHTIEKTVFEYSDLFSVKNRKLLEKILDKHMDINTEHDSWHYFCLEDNKAKLHEIGFEDSKIYYRGFWSQGDGACFECNNFNIEKLLKNDIMKKNLTEKNINLLIKLYDCGYFDIAIEKNSFGYHYDHEKARYIDISSNILDFKKHARIYKILNTFEVCLENLRYNLSCDIYSSLNREYEELQSDFSILEILEYNEYEFNQDGTIY